MPAQTIREQLQAVGIDNGPNGVDADVQQLLNIHSYMQAYVPANTDIYVKQFFVHTKHWRKQCAGELTWNDLCPCVKCYAQREYVK